MSQEGVKVAYGRVTQAIEQEERGLELALTILNDPEFEDRASAMIASARDSVTELRALEELRRRVYQYGELLDLRERFGDKAGRP
jgi:hypothetical protein